MTTDNIKIEFLEKFKLSSSQKITVLANWDKLEWAFNSDFLINGNLVGFPEFICHLTKSHFLKEDRDGNSKIINTANDFFKGDNFSSTTTSVVPDANGHIRGCIEQTTDFGYSNGTPPVYFGLTDHSFFFTKPYRQIQSDEQLVNINIATYVDLNNPGEGIQEFPQGCAEYKNLIQPTVDQIKEDINTYNLGALVPAAPEQ